MTTSTAAPTPSVSRRALSDAVALAAGLGVALGVVDLVLIRLLPYPLADLANSSAMWAVAAFVLGRSLDAGPAVAAAAGAVFLVVGVESYYLAASAVDLAASGSLITPRALAWCLMAVLAGASFGAAGAWSREPGVWRPAAAVAVVVGVLLAEAWLRRGLGDTAVLTAAMGAGALVAASRDVAVMARAAVLVVPVTVACVAGFFVAGF